MMILFNLFNNKSHSNALINISRRQSFSTLKPNNAQFQKLKTKVVNGLSLSLVAYGCYIAYKGIFSQMNSIKDVMIEIDKHPPIQLDDNILSNPKDYNKMQVILEGCFDNQNHIFIGPRNNLNHKSEFGVNRADGYHVLTPFILKDGRRILVNRGFISNKHKANPLRIKLGEMEGSCKIIAFLVTEEECGLRTSLRSLFNLNKKWIYSDDFTTIDLPLYAPKVNLSISNAYFIARSTSNTVHSPIGDQIIFNTVTSNYRPYLDTLLCFGLACLVRFWR